MDARQYRRALAEIIQDAAVRGVITRSYRTRPGRHREPRLDSIAGATRLVDVLAWPPPREMPVVAQSIVGPLQPELGQCLGWLRELTAYEKASGQGERHMRGLAARLRDPAPAELVTTAAAAAGPELVEW